MVKWVCLEPTAPVHILVAHGPVLWVLPEVPQSGEGLCWGGMFRGKPPSGEGSLSPAAHSLPPREVL